MDNDSEQLICKIEQMETYIHELETKLDDREYENAQLADKMYAGFDMLDTVKTKQDELFHELENKNKELIRELDAFQCMFNTRSLCYQEEIDCLKYWLDKNEARSKEELKNMEANHLDKIKTMQKQLSCVMKKFQNCQRLLKSELEVKDQEIIGIQNSLADKIMKYGELEKKLSIEQDRSESLQTSLSEFKFKYEKDVCATQAEMTRLRTELKQNVTKLEETEHQLQETRNEIVKRTTEFEKTIEETKEALCKEKNQMEEKNNKLKASNKSLVSSMESINTKLCNSLMENKTLKCQITNQNEAIKVLEAMKDKLQQEIENIKENEELSAKILITEREQHAREKMISEKKLEFKAQDERELKELSTKLSERIKYLNKMIHENDLRVSF